MQQLTTRAGAAVEGALARPTFAPAASICRQLPGFTTVDQYPIRSPLAVADFLAPIVKDRSFTEIGTRNGDIMGCLSHFAKRVTAIELDKVYCRKLRERGFTVICKAVETVPAAELLGDVYFWWPMWSPKQNEAWLRLLMSAHAESGRHAVAYIAHDTHWPADMMTLKRLAPHYRATNVTRLFFDEGADPVAKTLPGHQEAVDAAHATHRPGQWGVFHMARFELGGPVPRPQGVSEQGQLLLPDRYRDGRPNASEWRTGFCEAAETLERGLSDACEHHESGSVPLGGYYGVRTRQHCVDFCFARCRQCRYVSFSKELNDCSWYARCDLTALRTSVDHGKTILPFVTREVKG